MNGLSYPLYKSILLKISGEVLSSSSGCISFDEIILDHIIASIKQVQDLKVKIGIVIGGGNILRGSKTDRFSRVSADHIGMISTIINGLVFQELLKKKGCKVKLLSSFACGSQVEGYSTERANFFLNEGNIVIFCGGTGSCFFSTDTAAAVRALEMGAEILIKATKVDGVYDHDPKQRKEARRFDKISYSDILKKNLKVMDATSIALCRENRLPIYVLDIFSQKNLKELIVGEQVGTLISGE